MNARSQAQRGDPRPTQSNALIVAHKFSPRRGSYIAAQGRAERR
jgi:hypothetical protein